MSAFNFTYNLCVKEIVEQPVEEVTEEAVVEQTEQTVQEWGQFYK